MYLVLASLQIVNIKNKIRVLVQQSENAIKVKLQPTLTNICK